MCISQTYRNEIADREREWDMLYCKRHQKRPGKTGRENRTKIKAMSKEERQRKESEKRQR